MPGSHLPIASAKSRHDATKCRAEPIILPRLIRREEWLYVSVGTHR